MRSFIYAFLFSLLIPFVSCQKIDGENEEEMVQNKKAVINVTTRASGDTCIVYPVKIYAFDADGKLKAFQILNKPQERISMSLSKGAYHLVAISGMCNDYLIPENPLLTDNINISKGFTYKNALMSGSADIEVRDVNTNVNILMNFAVSSLSVSFDNIPTGTKNVTFSITPCFRSLSFGNTYKDDNSKISVACKLRTNGKWMAGPFYIFPTSAKNSLFTVEIEQENMTSSYGYTYNGALEPSTPYLISATYSGGILVGGMLSSKGWTNPVDISFSYGGGNLDDTESTDQNKPDANLPKVGDIWNGTIVADVGDTHDNETLLLLLSLKIWEVNILEAQSKVNEYVVKALDENNNWRIPSYTEATYLRKNFNGSRLEELNSKLAAIGEYKIYDDDESRYLCHGKDTEFASFRFYATSNIVKTFDQERFFYLRAVRNYSYKGQ